MDLRTNYLMANNVGAPIASGTTQIKATASTNSLISTSSNYLIGNGMVENDYVVIGYNSTMNMIISSAYFIDPSATFSGYCVYVDLTPIPMPTMTPSSSPASSSSSTYVTDSTDDDQVKAAKGGAIAAAVFGAIIVVLLIVVIVLFMNKSNVVGGGGGQKEASAPSGGIVMSPMTGGQGV
jgi:hypothetical protein